MTKTRHSNYSESFVLEVLRDYYSSNESKSFIVRKWGLSCLSLLLQWIKRYPIDSELLSLAPELILSHSMANTEKSREQLLEEEVLKLRKALEMEKLRSRGFEKLIEIAEKEERISILKKGGAKQ